MNLLIFNFGDFKPESLKEPDWYIFTNIILLASWSISKISKINVRELF